MIKEENGEVIVNIDKFEGPIDLLLYKIEHSQMSIYDISISKIIQDYLDYIEFMKSLNINIASEFLIVAATLTYIKSRMLLPEFEEEEKSADEFEKPTKALMDIVLEYQKYKKVSKELKQRLEESLGIADIPKRKIKSEQKLVDADISELVNAFRKIISKQPPTVKEFIIKERIDPYIKAREVLQIVKEKDVVDFEELINDQTNLMEMVVTFLVILELAKNRLISIKQETLFGKIKILKGEAFSIEE